MFENIRHAERSDTGLLKSKNEDSCLAVDRHSKGYDWERLGLFFAVADGLGGHAAGDVASRMACRAAASAYYNGGGTSGREGEESESALSRLEKALWSVHHTLIGAAAACIDLRGMGTTLSALVFHGGRVFMAHVGNCRIYRFRNRSCERLTVDHTGSQLLIDSGKIQAGQEENHCCRHVITQALGGCGDLALVQTRMEPVLSGDRFVLCTAGLHNLVADHEIDRIMARHPSPRAASDALVDAAVTKGGYDDVTVMVIET
ncbi:MAG: PP2C family serine/threonine-protein phosphatase [Thermodesulfobacteriota bacterium]